MIYKKLFFPIGGGKELKQRVYGAFLIAKHFDCKLEVLESRMKTKIQINEAVSLPKEIQKSIDEVIESQEKEKDEEIQSLVKDLALEVGLDEKLIKLNIKKGIRSSLVEQDSKFCDLVVAAAPTSGITTATFEAAVLKSGKPVLMFPRVMQSISFDSVIIGWNNSPEASKAISSSIEILKSAKRVKIVSSKEYVGDISTMNSLIEYLSNHSIKAEYEIVKTTRVAGEALLTSAVNGEFDLIVAGAYGHKGLKELMFGGTTRYLLENSKIPVFLAH